MQYTRKKVDNIDKNSYKKSKQKSENLNPKNSNLYFNQLIKKNGPIKQLKENMKTISEQVPLISSDIHSIFINDEKRKQVMNMVKKMRDRQLTKSKQNLNQISSPNIFNKNLQKSSSVNRSFGINTNYNNNNYNIPNENFNENQNYIYSEENNRDNPMYQTNYIKDINSAFNSETNKSNNNFYEDRETKERIMFDNLKIENFKISLKTKRRRKKITEEKFFFSIENSKIKSFNENENIIKKKNKNESEKNAIMNDNFTGFKIIQIENGKEINSIEIGPSIKSLNKEIKDKKILLNEKEFKYMDEEMLENENKKAIEKAFKNHSNSFKKNLQKANQEIEFFLLGNIVNKENDKEFSKEELKKELENQRENIEKNYKLIIENSLKKKEKKYNENKEKEINELIEEIKLKEKIETKRLLEEQKQMYEKKIENILKEKQANNSIEINKNENNKNESNDFQQLNNKNKSNVPSAYIRKMLKVLEEEKEREKIKYKNKLYEKNNIKEEIEDSFSSIFKKSKTSYIPDVIGVIDKKPHINYKKQKPTFYSIYSFEQYNDNNYLTESIDSFNTNMKKNELRMKIKAKKK